MRNVLWGGASADEAGDGPGPWISAEFALFPSTSRPHLLVPLSPRPAASSAVRQTTNATRTAIHAARAVVGLGMRTGIAQNVLRGRARLAGPPASAASLPNSSPLQEHLEEVIGRKDLSMAITVGAVRANRKPVVQLITARGERVAYAKVGWNELTRGLVRNEAAVLATIGEQRPVPAAFRVPPVLHAGAWRNLEILVVAPAGESPWHRRHAHLHPPMAATKEVSRLFGSEQGPVADSVYWLRIKERVSAIAGGHGAVAQLLPELVDDLTQRHGDDVVDFGGWHGDWVPWNMKDSGRDLVVWDWERAGLLAPVGLDVLQFDFQVGLWIKRKTPDQALEELVGRSSALLRGMGCPEGMERLLLSLNLLEVALRLEEGLGAGVAVPREIHSALPRLFARVARYPR